MADVASPNSVGGNSNGGARIGRPPQWTESRSRKLARLYMYTTLPMEKIIKALFPNDDVKKNSAQKTLHKMVGHDPRPLRPVTRADMNTRFKLINKRGQRRQQSDETTAQQEEGVTAVKRELNTPAFLEITRFDDADTLRSPRQDGHLDLASPSTLASASPGPLWSAFPKDDVELPLQTPFPRPPRHDTVFTSSTQMSTDSIKSLRNRIRVSTVFAKQVSLLMSRLTIGSSENLGTSPCRTPSDSPTHHHPFAPGQLLHPGLAVPGDFMIARSYVISCNAVKHFRMPHGERGCTCWCEIADEVADLPQAFYMTERGDICDAASNILHTMLDASCPDQFGNTLLHLFAALDSPQGVQSTFHLIESGRANPHAVNKAGQTFLHTLNPSWFSGADDVKAPLYNLLNKLYLTHKDLVFVRDVYGRTFFHQLGRYIHDPQIINYIVQRYPWSSIPRDAFGVMVPSRVVDPSFPPPRRTGTTALSPLSEETPENFVARDFGLASIVTNAYNNPAIEDEDGRNGLHCLAEMSFASSNPSSPDPSSPNPNDLKSPVNTKGSLKRKHGKDDVDKPIKRRLEYLQGLLTPVSAAQPPDVNHYDKKGNTVLMAFAAHLLDDQDDKSGQNIGKILDLLIQNGARLDARNRLGETALLVAARYGNKHVVSILLEKGANLYARDKYGRGIMDIIDAQISRSSRHLSSYGRLEAVRAAVLAKKLDEKGL
ncbi:Ankyrin-2 [Cytospora mali]|uniref:Ankyrin-2 n=1 Tax=Cytospora mali TaxID=578113 RepID=A0A194UU80_CYTMA|nr:Ankyrin-2 [Valsa mali var. pyri (nom. inval.)]